jgi:hypothetical protein
LSIDEVLVRRYFYLPSVRLIYPPAFWLTGGPDPIHISFLFHQINQQRIHYCYLNSESADFSETIAIGFYRLP